MVVHLKAAWKRKTLCGVEGKQPLTTLDDDKVTCKKCLYWMDFGNTHPDRG